MESLLQTLGPVHNKANLESINRPELSLTNHQVAPNSHSWLDDFLSASSSSTSNVSSSSNPTLKQSFTQFKNDKSSKSIRPIQANSFQRPSLDQWAPFRGGPGFNNGFMRPRFMSMFRPSTSLFAQPQLVSKPAKDYLEDFHKHLEEEKAKAKNAETARKSFDASSLPEEARKFVESMRDDPEIQNTDFLNFIQKIGSGEYQVTEEGIISNDSDHLSQAWAQEYATAQEVWEDNAVRDDQEFWDSLANDWATEYNQNSISDITELSTGSMADNEEFSSPTEYKFNSNNPYQDSVDPFTEGLKKLEDGDIPSAVLHFEAACQKDPSQALYWQYLGTSQAENEHDSSAILALKKCVQLQPDNLTALMALAVSHTNQSDAREACENLFLWIIRNPHYSSLVPEEYKTTTLEVVTSEKLRRVRDMYLQAARLSPQPLDADIQCGLGVLLNLTGEYSKAADCFRAALSARPEDPTLWNRLGATLANGDKSEEAVAAYEKALSISPGFIRSRFNLGIACINLGAHRQAAEHFLSVLNLQHAGHGADGQSSHKIMSANVWSALRLVLSLMSRQDLYKYIESRDLQSLNREFNITEFSQNS